MFLGLLVYLPYPISFYYDFLDLICDANSSTSIFVMYSPGTTTRPKYRAVKSMVTESGLYMVGRDELEGSRYS